MSKCTNSIPSELLDLEMAAQYPCSCWDGVGPFSYGLSCKVTSPKAMPFSGEYVQRLRWRCKGRAIGPGDITLMGHVTPGLPVGSATHLHAAPPPSAGVDPKHSS